MIAKRTDELLQGDRVHTPYGILTVAEVETQIGELVVYWVHDDFPRHPDHNYADRAELWRIEPADAPSPLDLAIQRAQELADQWFNNEGITGKEITELMDLFRAAR